MVLTRELRGLKELEYLSSGLSHKWYLPGFFFSGTDAEIIQDIQAGISRARSLFEVHLYVDILVVGWNAFNFALF